MRIIIGEVLCAHGSSGEVRVLPVTDFPERFLDLGAVYLDGEAEPRAVQRVRRHGRHFLVKLEGVGPEEAAILRWRRLELPPEKLAPLPEGHYYLWQIVGLEVFSTDQKQLGVVREVLTRPANDVYVVSRPDGSDLLVPATRQVVVAIDIRRGHLIVKLLPGMDEREE